MIILMIISGYPVVLCQSPSRIFHQDDWPKKLVGHGGAGFISAPPISSSRDQEGVMDDTLRVIEFGRCRVERRSGAGRWLWPPGPPQWGHHEIMGEQIEQDSKIASCFIVQVSQMSRTMPQRTFESTKVADILTFSHLKLKKQSVPCPLGLEWVERQ